PLPCRFSWSCRNLPSTSCAASSALQIVRLLVCLVDVHLLLSSSMTISALPGKRGDEHGVDQAQEAQMRVLATRMSLLSIHDVQTGERDGRTRSKVAQRATCMNGSQNFFQTRIGTTGDDRVPGFTINLQRKPLDTYQMDDIDAGDKCAHGSLDEGEGRKSVVGTVEMDAEPDEDAVYIPIPAVSNTTTVYPTKFTSALVQSLLHYFLYCPYPLSPTCDFEEVSAPTPGYDWLNLKKDVDKTVVVGGVIDIPEAQQPLKEPLKSTNTDEADDYGVAA
ncbi:hypothetical protein BDY19DRAFT_1020164, partial [Irpex rosettiformis]